MEDEQSLYQKQVISFSMLKITIFQIGHKRDGCHFTFPLLRHDLPPFNEFCSSMLLFRPIFSRTFYLPLFVLFAYLNERSSNPSPSPPLLCLHVENHLINIFASLFTEKPSSHLTLGFRLSSASMTYFTVCNLQCTISRLFDRIILSVYNLHFTGSLPPLTADSHWQSNVRLRSCELAAPFWNIKRKWTHNHNHKI